MEVNQKKTLKTILNVIGLILFIIVIVKLRVGFYTYELPLYIGLMIVGFICAYFAKKMKIDENDDAAVAAPVAHKTWKCSCGSVNEIDTLFCGECGNKKPVIQPQPAIVKSSAAPKNWNCGCGAQNDKDSAFCWKCGATKTISKEN